MYAKHTYARPKILEKGKKVFKKLTAALRPLFSEKNQLFQTFSWGEGVKKFFGGYRCAEVLH